MALAFNTLPARAAWLEGLVFGWFIFALSNCVAVPVIKGQPLFYWFDPNRLLPVFLIPSGFGTATALLCERLAGRLRAKKPGRGGVLHCAVREVRL